MKNSPATVVVRDREVSFNAENLFHRLVLVAEINQIVEKISDRS